MKGMSASTTAQKIFDNAKALVIQKAQKAQEYLNERYISQFPATMTERYKLARSLIQQMRLNHSQHGGYINLIILLILYICDFSFFTLLMIMLTESGLNYLFDIEMVPSLLGAFELYLNQKVAENKDVQNPQENPPENTETKKED